MQVDGLILAGGKSSRMGGKHKGDLMYGDTTFIEGLISELKNGVRQMWISYGTQVHHIYDGCEVVQDEYLDCGPIGGIHAGLKHCTSEAMLIAACDMPYLKKELYQYLYSYLEPGKLGVVPCVNGRRHPLASIYRKEMYIVFEGQIKEGKYRIQDALKKVPIAYVDIEGDSDFAKMLSNINTLEEYWRGGV